jgi:hypothetical protein
MSLAPQSAGSQGYTLPVVAGTGSHHTTGALLRGKLAHAVVSTTPFVGLNGAQILALSIYHGIYTRQVKALQGGRLTHCIHALACLQYLLEQLVFQCAHNNIVHAYLTPIATP